MRFGRFAVHNGADFRESDVGGRSKQRPYGPKTLRYTKMSTEPDIVNDADPSKLRVNRLSVRRVHARSR